MESLVSFHGLFFWMLYLKLDNNTFEVELLGILLLVVVTRSYYRKVVNSTLSFTIMIRTDSLRQSFLLSSHCVRCLFDFLFVFCSLVLTDQHRYKHSGNKLRYLSYPLATIAILNSKYSEFADTLAFILCGQGLNFFSTCLLMLCNLILLNE